MTAGPQLLGVRVAGLGYWVDSREAGLRLEMPPSHTKFLQPPGSCQPGDLVLQVRNTAPPDPSAGGTPLCRNEIWELWQDEAGQFVFVAPRQQPPSRHVVVDTRFSRGEVVGDFSSCDGSGVWPLKGVDIMLFANWLANIGDVILHATGVAVGGKGYAFAGTSGVGKSTLTANLVSASRAAAASGRPELGEMTVLGEDQVVLRHLDGGFRIYGTPWHFDPSLCSPYGVPLEKLFFLQRTGWHGVASCPPLDGVVRLLQTAFVPYYNRAGVPKILDRLGQVADSVPFFTLGYRLGADVWSMVEAA